MAETDRAEAQRRRADARRQRRADGNDGDSEEAERSADTGGGDGGSEDEAHAALKHAAKVAAAGAAVGAAVGAALAARDASPEDGDDERRPDDVAEQQDAEDTPEAAVQQAEEKEEKPESAEVERPLGAAAGEDEPVSRPEAQSGDRDSGAPQKGAPPDETVEVADRARQQLQALHGREPESVSSLARTAEGWAVTIEVVELPRVPDSTDVMASYELLLDEDKNLIRYERRRRYYRSQADRGGDS